MKKEIGIFVIILLIVAGCSEKRRVDNDDFITVDVTKSYPQKKDIILQDFMDVEYIPLETNDDFLTQGFVQAIGKEFIIVKNRVNDGNIYIYDKNGKALRKFNHKGQSPEEYTSILGMALDEENNEIFINDHYKQILLVYDLTGKFKRSFKHKEGGGSLFYTNILNYDKDNLICYDKYNEATMFVIVSKQDGSIVKEIQIPFEEKKDLNQQRTNGEQILSVSPGPYRPIGTYRGKWILLEFSSDTIYTLLPDYSLQPFMVRTPPINSMDPEEMLILRLFSDRYYFMESIKNTYNFDSNSGFPRTFFAYDKQEKEFIGYTVYNGDYSSKQEIYMNILRPVDHDIDSYQTIEAHRLVESLEKGNLKDGKLKEIASKLDAEDNPVIMLVKHKK